MAKNFLSRIYRQIPYLRELPRINDTLAKIMHATALIQRQLDSQHAFDVIKFLDFEMPNHPRYGDPKRLLRYAFQACSQNGEDGMIHEIFNRVGRTNRTFIEIGAGDGNENNTAFLISQGWRGYWLDGGTKFIDSIEERGWQKEGIVKGHQAFITKENVATLLKDLGASDDVDLLSIDIDQNTYYVWEALAAFRPRVVVVEYNSALPPDMEWVVNYSPTEMWDGSQNFGASLKSFELLAARLGYCLVGCDFHGVNAFFVRKDLCGDKFAAPFTSENHYEPPRYGALCRRSHPPKALDRYVPTSGTSGNR